MTKLALVVIATGQRYWDFFPKLLVSANQFLYPHETLFFTDWNVSFEKEGARQIQIEHLGWPGATLMRYHIILKEKAWLSTFDQILYIDVDSYFIGNVGEEIFSSGITAQIHPRLVGQPGTFETDPRSTAYVAPGATYYLGALQGGQSAAFLSMAETIKANIDEDLSWGHRAVWWDESHLNRYLLDNPPAKVLPIGYCYPQEWGKFKENDVRIISPEKDSGAYHGV